MIPIPRPPTRLSYGPVCRSGKTVFPSEASAKAALFEVRSSKELRYHTPIRVYRCEKCSGWHLTHQSITHPAQLNRKVLP